MCMVGFVMLAEYKKSSILYVLNTMTKGPFAKRVARLLRSRPPRTLQFVLRNIRQCSDDSKFTVSESGRLLTGNLATS